MPTRLARGRVSGKNAQVFVVLKKPLAVNEKLFQKLWVVL
jgi:hypothetical protein